MFESAARDFGRLRRITTILAKYGYAGVVQRTDLPVGEPSERAVGPGPRRFRLMLEELGPTFIKFGQVLSSRPDLVSRDFVEELKSLQDRCEPLPFDSIARAIEDGLGRPLSELFSSVDPNPLATASIAQVHRGVTLAGDQVVIKVQRPGISDQVRRDIDILYGIARLLDVVIEESQLADPNGIVREFDKALSEELNFQHEAANLREFGRLHEHRKDIAIPVVFEDRSSSTVLTMSYLEGTPFSRLPADVDRSALAERIVREAFDEVFIDGVFHADPHPGNLLYLNDGRYGILDLGLLGRLTPAMKETLVVLALAIAVRDADTIARTLYRLGSPDERVDLAEVRRDTLHVLNHYFDKRIEDVDSQLMVQELLMLGMKHRLRVPAEYTMLGRAGATIEGIVRELDPKIDVSKVARPYAEKLLMERVAPGAMEGGLYKALLQFQGLSQDLPLQLSQIMSDVSAGKLGVSVGGQQLEKLSQSIMVAATMLAGAILGGAFVIGAFIGLAQLETRAFGVPLVGAAGLVVGAAVLTWLSAYSALRPRLRKISLTKLIARFRGRS